MAALPHAPHLLCGQTLQFTSVPLAADPARSVVHHRHGAVAVQGGRIVAVGPADVLAARHPDAQRHDYGDHLILPGFVDCHAHMPQVRVIASWGSRLIEWLEGATFPEEARYGDPRVAEAGAAAFLDRLLEHGTTSVGAFCTVHPASVDALFTAAQARSMRITAGRVCSDRNVPEALLDRPGQAGDESEQLLARWHGVDRLSYAITPRFAPTSSPEQLAELGALWAAHPGAALQTHLSEQAEEVAWVRTLFPDEADYLAVYERFGLCGPGAVFGHGIHLSPSELERLAAAGASIAHCPTSNLFLGSGLLPVAQVVAHGVNVGLATDVGGGSSFSMLRTMAAAYEVSQLAGAPLHPAQLLWLATVGSARALRIDHAVGALQAGHEADLVVLDLASTPAIRGRADGHEALWSSIFATIMMGDDRAVADVWVNGAAVPLPPTDARPAGEAS